MSDRGLTANMQTEITKPMVEPVLFVDLDFDTTPLRLWSGVGSITWDSKTWLGAGQLGRISMVEETNTIESKGIVLEFDGIDSANIALALTENYQGRAANVWFGFLSSAGAIVADPIKIFSGRMDVPSIDDGVETAIVAVTAENRTIALLTPNERRRTHEDQQIEYAGDLGLEFVPDLQNKELRWVAS